MIKEPESKLHLRIADYLSKWIEIAPGECRLRTLQSARTKFIKS